MLSLCLKKHPNAVKKPRRLNKGQIKNHLLVSFVYDDINKEDLSERADTTKDYREAIKVIEECENIIKTNKKKMIGFAYEQVKIFKKFKEDTKSKNLVEQFGISKTTVIFNINIVKLVEKCNKMEKFSDAKLFKKLL